MPTLELDPTSNTTPNIGGTSAVTDAANTGHGATQSAATRTTDGTTTQNKTCRWGGFSAPSGTILSVTLKFDWEASGSVAANSSELGDSGSSEINFGVEYTVDNGSNWTPIVSEGVSANASAGSSDSDTLDESGSASQSLSTSVNFSQVQLRDSISASATVSEDTAASGNCSITATVSDIRLEVLIAEAGQRFLLMMT